MTRNILARTVSAAAMLAAFAGAASAQSVTLNGGGATLPQPTYQNEFQLYTQSFPSVAFSYDGVGSGAGQNSFLNNDITQYNSPSNQYGTIVGTTVYFGASDAFLNSAQVSATGGYARSATDGPLIQLPMIGVGVTLPYVNSGLARTLVLNDDQVCGILSGKLTNWSQISRAATPGTITVVYRSDGSGTSFLLTNHLNAVCTSANSTFVSYPVPITKYFGELFPNSTPPSNFNGQSGSAAVASTMLSIPLSFGYLSPDYTSIAPKSSNTTSLKVASLTNGINGVTYVPTAANISNGLKNAGPGSTNATPPSNLTAAQNPLNWVPSVPVTKLGYSIVGYTTWEVSTCYASKTAGSDVNDFLTKHFTVKAYQTQISNNGFAPLSNTAAAPYVTSIKNTFLSNRSGFNLNINNATTCAGLPGR